MAEDQRNQNPNPPTDDIAPTSPQPVNEDITDQGHNGFIMNVSPNELRNMKVFDPESSGHLNRSMLGSSGTRIFGELFDEEYLSKLTGMLRADIFDEMMRSDDIINMLLTARKNPILKAKWDIQPAKGDTPEEEEMNQRIADACKHEFFERMEQDFKEFLEECLTFVEQGYSLFERVHKLVKDPKFGQYIGYEKFGWRSQRTIERWTLTRKGKIASVFQQADGDLEAHINIPGNFVTVFSLRKKGDNYEGISALRPIYGNWQRKNLFLKLLAIGIERYAINTPVGKVPKGKENDSERDTFIEMLKKISSHQNNYMVLAEGWDVDFTENKFDVDKVVKAIEREDEGMVKSFVANHLNLGSGSNGGAYSLGTDLSDQFLSIIENDAEIIIRRFNKEIIREFVDINFGEQSVYPKLTVSGINDKFSKEFSEIMTSLADSKMITATENLEEWVRRRLGLPELLEEDKLEVPKVRKQEQTSLFSEHLEGVQFTDQKTKSKVKEQLNKSAQIVSEAMQSELRVRGQALIDSLFKRLQGQPKSKWKQIIRTQKPLPNVAVYKRNLKRALTETASRAISQARNEVPGGRKVAFCEQLRSRMTLNEADEQFKKLPKNIRESILTDGELVVDKQFTDLRNAVLLAASNGTDETEDLNVVKKRAESELDRRVDGQGETGINGSILVAGTDTTSKVYNASRIEFFQVPEVLEKIDAFQFLNTNPVSPICQDLNGKIFPKDDPESAKFLPPLHPNCKSFIAPVFDLKASELPKGSLRPSNPKLEQLKSR